MSACVEARGCYEERGRKRKQGKRKGREPDELLTGLTSLESGFGMLTLLLSTREAQAGFSRIKKRPRSPRAPGQKDPLLSHLRPQVHSHQ